MTTAIVYFSYEGNCRYVAEKIAAHTGAELIAIEPKKAYSKGLIRQFIYSGSDEVVGIRPKLAPYDFDASKYDKIIIGSPVWAGYYAPAIGTFLEENDLSEKPVGIFVSSSESGTETAIKHMKDDFKLNNVIAELELISPLQGLEEEVTRRIDAFCAVL